MPRSNPYTPAFSAGELSPRLWARTDFSKYSRGLELCENILPLAEGGAMRRSGFRYVAAAKNSAVRSRLRSFIYSTEQAYMLEYSANAIRFQKDQGQIVSEDTDAQITNGTFGNDISGWTDLSTGTTGSIAHNPVHGDLRFVIIGADNTSVAEQSVATSHTGIEHILKFRIKGPPGYFIRLRIGASSGAKQYVGSEAQYGADYAVGFHCVPFTPTVSPFYVQFRIGDGNVGLTNGVVALDDVSIINGAVEIGSPYAEGDLPTVEGPQSADVLYLYHSDYPTHKLLRFGHSEWSLVEINWYDGPYLTENDTSTTLTPSQTTGVTITASSTRGINNNRGFLPTDVGRLIRISNPASGIDWGVVRIAAYQTSLVVWATTDLGLLGPEAVPERLLAQAGVATTAWRLGAWSETTGYPRNGAFYEQRMFACGTETQPQTFWATNTADFENMAPDSVNASGDWDGTVEADDALDYTLSSDDVNAIFWMSPGEDTLVIGTSGGEWVPLSSEAVLTPTDIVVRKQTSHGCAPIQPLRIGSVVLFVQKAKRKIREFGFSFDIDGYRAPDMTRLAQHVTKSTDRKGIVEMAHAEEPHSVVWAVRSDGQLLSMTYRREEDVVSWSRHKSGGSFSGGDAVVESVAVIPGADGDGQTQSSEDRDEVWVIVKRTINGQTKRYIEVLEGDFEHGDEQEDAYYADSCITYDGVPATTITGLDHLEGQTVSILADGAVHTTEVVASGQVVLDSAASVIQVGLAYKHKLKTLKVEGGTAAGTAVNKTKRISSVGLVVLDSHVVSLGPDENNLEEFDFREVADEVDEAVPYFTGEVFKELDGDWAVDPRIYIESDKPVPFTLLALAPRQSVNEVK